MLVKAVQVAQSVNSVSKAAGNIKCQVPYCIRQLWTITGKWRGAAPTAGRPDGNLGSADRSTEMQAERRTCRLVSLPKGQKV